MTREEAIRVLGEYVCTGRTEGTESRFYFPSNMYEVKAALDRAIAALREQESAKNAQCNGWISVEDRLPEENGYYLCWRNKEVKMLFWEDNLWLRQHNLLSTVNFVTHWMPLPEPPEVEV